MAKLPNFELSDFSGGLVLNKSDYELNKNEFSVVRNFDFDERGRLKVRLGSYNFAGQISNALYGFNVPTGSYSGGFLVNYFIFFDNANPSVCFRLKTTSTTSQINTNSTNVLVTSTSGFTAAASTFYVEGDAITYTAIASGTELTITASTILKQHLVGRAINQWLASVSTTDLDGRLSIYGAVLGGTLYLTGFTGAVTTGNGGATFTTINNSAGAGSDTDCPPGLFATNYRDRIYVAGSGGSHGALAGTTYRVFYSDVGSAAAWTSTSYFDIYDSEGGCITALFNYRDKLLIFKRSSLHYYNEVNLKQVSYHIGAYNQEVVQEIDGAIFAFCPAGVFKITNSGTEKISTPIEKYLNGFTPFYNSTTPGQRVITNCFSGKFKGKYYLVLKNIYLPDNDLRLETISDVVLVYDTKKKNWTVYTGFTNLASVLSVRSFPTGDFLGGEAMFWNNGTSLYKMFEDYEGGSNASNAARGKEVIADLINNNAGVAVSALLETKFYDLGNRNKWKTINNLRVLVEQGTFNISYRLDKGDFQTDWISLGSFTKSNETARLPDNQGYRIALQITSNELNTRSILNGIIVEDIEAKPKK